MGHAKKIYTALPPPYVHFVAKFPSFTGAKLLSLSTHPPPPPFIPSRGSRGCKSAYSPLPYNRLINQYNIFTERDSSERYCRYRETLSKARRTGRRRRRGSQSSTIVPSLFPNPCPPSLPPCLPPPPGSSLIRQRVHKRRGNEI